MEKSKNVKMKNEAIQEQKKISYDELEKIAIQLKNENNALGGRLQSAYKVISEFNDLELLLSIIDKAKSFDDSFVTRCSKKVQEIVTKMLDESEKNEEEKEK